MALKLYKESDESSDDTDNDDEEEFHIYVVNVAEDLSEEPSYVPVEDEILFSEHGLSDEVRRYLLEMFPS